MTNRQIFVGDVHGHYDALMSLLEAIAPDRNDVVYFVGDLIDRGPKSAQVVDFVIQNNYPCLLGNHEQMLLDALADQENFGPAFKAWLYSGGHSTIESYGKQGISQEHLDWIQKLPTYLDLGEIWLVHAGVDPNLPIEKQTSEQFCWIREPFHRMSQPYFADKLIITGHTITFTLPGVKPGKLAQGQGWLDIETGVYHPKSGWLTGLDMTQRQVYQFNVKQGLMRNLPLEKAVAPVKLHKKLFRH